MKRFRDMLVKLFARREFRFLIVGAINTLVGYGAYALLLSLNVNYLISVTLSTIGGVINSYIWNRYFTFRSKSRAASEIARFALVYLVSYCSSLVFLYFFVEIFGINPYVSGVINIIITTTISWFGHKNFSFKTEGEVKP